MFNNNNNNNNNNTRGVSCARVKHISSFDSISPTGFGPLSFVGSGLCVEGSWNGCSAIRDSVCLGSYIGLPSRQSRPGRYFLLLLTAWAFSDWRVVVCVCVCNTHTHTYTHTHKHTHTQQYLHLKCSVRAFKCLVYSLANISLPNIIHFSSPSPLSPSLAMNT